mmetsp:Transcript_34413/g.90557  ORF Transcript_34413/g.90557 Transcript_34413/m.90557 type:complete len:138 (-) Transcript_34413:153-566(-)
MLLYSFIESPFTSKVEYEAWLQLPEREKPAALAAARAVARGASAPEACAAADHLPDYVRRAINGELSPEEKVAALQGAQSAWRKKRFQQLPVEGTTRGEFISAGIIDRDSEAQRIVNLPFGSAERAAAEVAAREASK